MMTRRSLALPLVLALASRPGLAQVTNVKLVTDASPDAHDLESYVRSATSRWETPAEKCWAMFYWNHIGRRQTSPMVLHGLAVTDPIRQLNDYGYAMCSTVAGMNCSIWDAMGLPVRYWDISLHTVSECHYDGRWHLYDDSMSAIYTLCDGVTIAGVEDVGKEGACEASGGKVERGHIARYHCLAATSANGFLTGADCTRDLVQESNCFRPDTLKHRWYFHDWDRGHRYLLNLREGESYVRRFDGLPADAKGGRPFVPLEGKDPESVNPRYRLRGNGERVWRPDLAPGLVGRHLHASRGIEAADPDVLRPASPGEPGEATFKVEGANAIASLAIRGAFDRAGDGDEAAILVSTTNGLSWKEVWRLGASSIPMGDLRILEDEVSGSYEVLVKVVLRGKGAALRGIEFRTITVVNSKMLPQLRIGANTIHLETGDPTQAIVLWPDLRGERYKDFAVEASNIATRPEHPGYQGVLFAAKAGEPARIVFRIDAPRPIERVVHGGRFYNRAPGSRIGLDCSFDGGATWTRSWELATTDPPWDVIHHETVEGVPPGTRSVLFRYVLESAAAGPDACSLYAVRMEAWHERVDPVFRPLEVTFEWAEVAEDDSLRERGHTELVTSVPHRWPIAVGGEDHPRMRSVSIRVPSAAAPPRTAGCFGAEPPAGNSVGPAERHVPRWVAYGQNLAEGKPYAVSRPSRDNWGAGDPDGKRLTDGVVGPPYAGGTSPSFAACWAEGDDPEIVVDLGKPERCGAFRIHVSAGWPWWDALLGEVQDRLEVETSLDGKAFRPRGPFPTRLRRKDIPVNWMMPDDETATGPVFERILPEPVDARFVKFKVFPKRILTVSEVQALDWIRHEPFDLRIALPPPATQ